MFEKIIEQFLATTYLELVAFIFGIAQVVFAWLNKYYNFYFGIVSVAIYIYIFYNSHLYAEASLNLYYFIISIYGIFVWKSKKEQTLPITTSSKTEWLICIVIAIGSFVLMYSVLSQYTQSKMPLADSAVAAFAWAGTWLMTKRKIENWLVLNLSNAIAIPLQFNNGLYLTALLTSIIFVLAILGYLSWKNKLNEQNIHLTTTT